MYSTDAFPRELFTRHVQFPSKVFNTSRLACMKVISGAKPPTMGLVIFVNAVERYITWPPKIWNGGTSNTPGIRIGFCARNDSSIIGSSDNWTDETSWSSLNQESDGEGTGRGTSLITSQSKINTNVESTSSLLIRSVYSIGIKKINHKQSMWSR